MSKVAVCYKRNETRNNVPVPFQTSNGFSCSPTSGKTLIDNLPIDHAVCVYDFSESYKCSDQREIQSSYFQKTEVSIHVTILYRHSILEKDGINSSPENPKLIREQFFVISPDTQHDRSFTQYCQKQISANVTTYMYGRMDGWLFFSV